MVASGRWELGNHAVQATGGFVPIDAKGTQAYFLSNKMWLTKQNRLETDDEYRARLEHEITDDRTALEKLIGHSITAFAYPFSDYGQDSVNNVAQAQTVIRSVLQEHATIAFRQVWPNDKLYTSNYPGDDPYLLNRIESNTTWTGSELVQAVERARSKPLPFVDTFQGNEGWKIGWGDLTLSPGQGALSANSSTTGALMFLDGSNNWSDEMYTVAGTWQKGATVSLLTHYRNDNTFVSCTFTDGLARIDQRLNGVNTALAYTKNKIQLPHDAISLSMWSNGSVVRCYEGDQVVATTDQLSISGNGGIAFQIWDPSFNNAGFLLTAVRVLPFDQIETVVSGLPHYATE